jgi:hypothetical protein
MSRTLNILLAIFLVCLALAILGGLVWANVIYSRSQPVEKDFLVPWLGARTFIQYGDSPYGDPATQRAQIVYYGRLAAEGQDPLMLWLPFPVELFYFPIALVPDYVLARAIWNTCLEIALVALGYLALQLTGWKPWRVFLPIILLFPLFWVYGAFSLVSGSAAGFIALALAGFLLAIRSELDELAGALLILTISAPRLTGVLTFFIFWWIIYQRRWRVLWGFLMSLVLLLGLSFLFLPDWFLIFLRGMLLHFTYNPGFSSFGIFASWSPVVGLRLGWVLAAGLLIVLFFEWGNSFPKNFRAFLWTVSLSLSVTPLLGIPMVPMDYPFLFIPLMVFLSILAERRPWLKRWGIAGIMLVVFLAGLWLLTLSLVRGDAYAILANILILVLPVLLVIGLAWTRWWFTRTVPTGLDTPPLTGV